MHRCGNMLTGRTDENFPQKIWKETLERWVEGDKYDEERDSIFEEVKDAFLE